MADLYKMGCSRIFLYLMRRLLINLKFAKCQLFSLCRKTGHQRNELAKEELKNTIILAAKGMNLIDDASFQSTLDVKRQYTIGEDGVITVNKSEMDSDPFLLQRIMDQKLEGYDMPTADPVNYLNAGGSLGGPYAR